MKTFTDGWMAGAARMLVLLAFMITAVTGANAKTYHFRIESQKAWGLGSTNNYSTSEDVLTYDSGHLTIFSETEKLNQTGVKVTLESKVDDKFFFSSDQGNSISKVIVFWKGTKALAYVGYSEKNGKVVNDCIAWLSEWNGRQEWHHFYYTVNQKPSEFKKDGIAYRFYNTYQEMCNDIRNDSVDKAGVSAYSAPDSSAAKQIFTGKPMDFVDNVMMVIPPDKATWDYCRTIALANGWMPSYSANQKDYINSTPKNVILDSPSYGNILGFEVYFNPDGSLNAFSTVKDYEWEQLQSASLVMYMLKEQLAARGLSFATVDGMTLPAGQSFISGYWAPYKAGEVYLYLVQTSRGYRLALYRRVKL